MHCGCSHGSHKKCYYKKCCKKKYYKKKCYYKPYYKYDCKSYKGYDSSSSHGSSHYGYDSKY